MILDQQVFDFGYAKSWCILFSKLQNIIEILFMSWNVSLDYSYDKGGRAVSEGTNGVCLVCTFRLINSKILTSLGIFWFQL